jgi:riboflavin kinase
MSDSNSLSSEYNTPSPESEIKDSFDLVGEKEWFFLLWIAKFGSKNIYEVNTPYLCQILSISQQTISRRIIELEKMGYITRSFQKTGGMLKLTDKGIAQLRYIHRTLEKVLFHREAVCEYQGVLKSGMGEGAYYIQLPEYVKQFEEKLGFKPFQGTLNMELTQEDYQRVSEDLNFIPAITIQGFSDGIRTYGNVTCYRAVVWPIKNPEKHIRCALLLIQRTSHRPTIIEVIAEKYLRDYFTINDNEKLGFRLVK